MIFLQLIVNFYREILDLIGLVRHGDMLVKLLIILTFFPKFIQGEGKYYADTTTPDSPGTASPSVTTTGTVDSSYSTSSNETIEGIANGTLTVDMPDFGGLVVTDGKKDEDILATFVSSKLNQTAINETRANLVGRTLRVVAIKEPPYVNYLNLTPEARESMGHGPGIVMEILRELGEKLKVNYDIVEPDDGEWGEKNENGTWTGMVGMLERREVDILAGAVIIRYDRHAVVDFSYPFMSSETGMLIRSPDKYIDNTWLIVTRPFSWGVWMLIAASILVSGIFLKCYCYVLDPASEVQYSIWGSIWVFFSVFVQQGLPIQPKSWTCRTLLAFWWLAALTLVATFTGNMVALFAVDKTTLPFNSKEELVDRVERQGYRILMEGSTNTRTLFIKNSKRDIFKRLWYQMDTKKKVTYVNSIEEGVDLVKQFPNYVLIGPKETLEVAASTDCQVTVIGGSLLPVWFSICLQKRSAKTHVLSEEIRQLVEKGFIVKWMNDYQFYLASQKGKRCIYQEGISTRGTPITLERAQGAIWILFSGVVMGSVGIFSEYIMRAIRYSMKKMGCALSFLGRSVGGRRKNEETDLPPPHINGWIGPKGGLPPVAEPSGEIDMEGFSQIQVKNGKYATAYGNPENGKVNGTNGTYTNGYTNGFNLKQRKTTTMDSSHAHGD